MNEVWHARSGIVARGRACGRVRSRGQVLAVGASQRLEALPDTRSPQGRIYPLACLVAIALCAFTAAGNDRFTAVGHRQWVRQPGHHPRCRHRGPQRRRLPAHPRRPTRPHHPSRSPPPSLARLGQMWTFTEHAGALDSARGVPLLSPLLHIRRRESGPVFACAGPDPGIQPWFLPYQMFSLQHPGR